MVGKLWNQNNELSCKKVLLRINELHLWIVLGLKNDKLFLRILLRYLNELLLEIVLDSSNEIKLTKSISLFKWN